MYDSFTDEETTYPLQINTGPQIIDGYLYRLSSSLFTGKPISHPIEIYRPNKSSKGVPRKEKVPQKRGMNKRPTPPTPRTASGQSWR